MESCLAFSFFSISSLLGPHDENANIPAIAANANNFFIFLFKVFWLAGPKVYLNNKIMQMLSHYFQFFCYFPGCLPSRCLLGAGFTGGCFLRFTLRESPSLRES